MKAASIFLLLLPAQVFAQAIGTDTTNTVKRKTNAIGLLNESNTIFSSYSPYMNTSGIQYKRQNNKHVTHSVMLGYSSFSSNPDHPITLVRADTAYAVNTQYNINMAMAGCGVEISRHFYKKIHLYAGLELRAGYGAGRADTVATEYHNVLHFNPATNTYMSNIATTTNNINGPSAQMLYVGLGPQVGVTVELKRFSIGTSFLNYINFRTITSQAGGSYGVADFDMGNMTQRIFVFYKF